MRAQLAFFVLLALAVIAGPQVFAEPLTRAELERHLPQPYTLGDPQNDKGVYKLINIGGIDAGYAFETEPLAPLPGFSGAPINMLVLLDPDGVFLDVRLIEQNEPIFVSGLGEAALRRFLEQYAGRSITSSLVVGSPYGAESGGSSLVYLDGVTKATASVRIAHESIMGAALAVSREKMQGLSLDPPAYPDPAHEEPLTWDDLVAQRLATRLVVTNAEVDAAFAGTLWEDDDPEARADPDGVYLDLWVVDIGPPSIARAVLDDDGFAELQRFLQISPNDEPLLLIESARHGLVGPEFVRNTAPDWISAEQGGFPVALRDADLIFDLAPDVPEGIAMILRTDRRLGFDPIRDWMLRLQAVRRHGVFQPQSGSIEFSINHATDDRFFLRPQAAAATPPWLSALRDRQTDMILLAALLAGLVGVLFFRMNQLAGTRLFTPIRLSVLALVIGFVGWWGQGQLSIVTVLGSLRATVDGGSFAFLLYDPFSLLIWAVAILGFVLWGRGLFCGWLCPFGAMQEFAHHAGRILRLPRLEPTGRWDLRLKSIKYVLLAGMIATAVLAPGQVDAVAEIEPFKTAITTLFIRDWYYVAYAAFWLAAGMLHFKGFCRYVCPLGAVMAIGGLVRGRDWIARRPDCGNPCQLCRVKCNYGAIGKTGEIRYSECFQCLDCVTIHNDDRQCVPLVLAKRPPRREPFKAASAKDMAS
ncbi:4Fe-4S binding protein [Sedimentitalea sp. JM2-8]|uniref:4Fe-4S binding protein n=1 Tax=Sedimentitalea xiamensis TaxID=3050037 RepID=A0ABT7FAL7_9RHOB|nr:4Fe-4S binding protein [Sedimentitalea xiamensis]MDK3071894.1 4Fe-4S binding protein [Sedimentitalea xiamensis]